MGVKRVALSRPIAVLDGKNLVLAVILAAADKGRAFQERAQPIKKCHHISAAACSLMMKKRWAQRNKKMRQAQIKWAACNDYAEVSLLSTD
jgi:hypothetical protein